jgi:PhoPQ-activated pathogenicity-related protein
MEPEPIAWELTMFCRVLLYCFVLVLPSLSLLSSPLDDYILAPDSHYQWTVVKRATTDKVEIFELQLTSQKWRNEKEVDKPLWTHELVIAVPKELRSTTAVLTIGGGISSVDTGNAYAEIPLEELAISTGAVACEISLIPNQHLKFPDEWDERYTNTGRREDALVAYTWDKYLKTEDSHWLLRLPMTKAVVRAMDAVQEVLAQQLKISVNGFILMGKSKRGWTAWTTAAVDKRVKGIIPIVIDLLNLKESFTRHFKAYGNWSPAIRDYADIKLDEKWEGPTFKKLMGIVEPFSYNERFTMPKYIINATGDEFFLPDSSRLYLQHLPGEKHLLYLPNTGHHVTPEMYQETVLAYLQFLLSDKPLPSTSWELTKENVLTVKSTVKPHSVKLWHAENPAGRDFRIHTIGKSWKESTLAASEDGSYKVTLKEPEIGWSADYIEFTFMSPQGLPLRVGTDLFVLPDLFPFDYSTKNGFGDAKE